MATHLQRLAKEPRHPATFKAAVFPANTALELVEVQFKEPGQNELAIKVHACALSNNDAISAQALLPSSKYPRTPGMAVVGEVVALGTAGSAPSSPTSPSHREGGGNGKLSSMMSKLTLGKMGHGKKSAAGEGNFKVGDKVIATFDHQGLAEYCTAHVPHTAHVSPGYESLDQLVAATSGARVLTAYNRFAETKKRRSEEMKKALAVRDEEIGFKGEGVVVVYGEGGYARMALTAISLAAPEKLTDQRVVLVTPSDRFSHDDYRIPERDMLVVGKQNVAEELKAMGGVALVIATGQPGYGFNKVLDSMRHGSEVVLLTLAGKGIVDLNIGPILARSLTLIAAPLASGPQMRRALAFLESHDIRKHIKIHTLDFTVQGVNEAWELARKKDTMLAPVVVFGYKGGLTEQAAAGVGTA